MFSGKWAIGIRQLLCFLSGKVDAGAKVLFWAVLSWLACAIDHSDVITAAPDVPLAVPHLTGSRVRTLEISNALKYKVGKIASRGDIYRTGLNQYRTKM